jgi:hypothetical protein
MAGKIVRAAVVGASTLQGKELAEELNGAHRPWHPQRAGPDLR